MWYYYIQKTKYNLENSGLLECDNIVFWNLNETSILLDIYSVLKIATRNVYNTMNAPIFKVVPRFGSKLHLFGTLERLKKNNT